MMQDVSGVMRGDTSENTETVNSKLSTREASQFSTFNFQLS
jgi:hypothetical protein